jgi:hypothetical protein
VKPAIIGSIPLNPNVCWVNPLKPPCVDSYTSISAIISAIHSKFCIDELNPIKSPFLDALPAFISILPMKSPFLLVKSPLFSTFSPGSFSPRQAACSAFATLEETVGVESVG